jgi:hypothetical protein
VEPHCLDQFNLVHSFEAPVVDWYDFEMYGWDL